MIKGMHSNTNPADAFPQRYDLLETVLRASLLLSVTIRERERERERERSEHQSINSIELIARFECLPRYDELVKI